MAQKEMTLTSVKVKSDLFDDFKIECVKRDFRKKINSQVNLEKK